MDEKQIREAAAKIEAEWQMGGLTGGLYEDFAVEVAKLAVAAERERCARLAVEAAAAAVKKYEDDTAPVRQPYANNRLMHVGWAAADLIRGSNDGDKPPAACGRSA